MIELRTLGTAEIRTISATVTPSQEILFAAALYLVLERGKRIRRDRLASLIWPSGQGRHRSHRLRQTILQLKKIGVGLATDRDTLYLRSDEASTDSEIVAERAGGYSGNDISVDFLPGYSPTFSEPFADWVDSIRSKFEASAITSLLQDLAAARHRGDWQNVDRIAEKCLSLDSFNETALLARAEGFAMRGQKVEAVSILDEYIREVSPISHSLTLPATILRKRVAQHVRPSVSNQFVAEEHDCVGREAEIAILAQYLDLALNGHGSGCLINGEPGIGKTRLSCELAKFAQLQGVRVERVTCKRSDTDQPLSAFVSLVPKLRELPGGLGVSQQSLLWLKRLVEVDTTTAGARAITENSGSLYTNLRSAVFDLLDAVSDERVVILLIDDIQWLDRASANLFGSILEWVQAKKVLLLFTSRQPRTLLQEFVSPEKLRIINLRPLGNAEALSIIAGVLGQSGHDTGSGQFDWLIQTADGNPYFLQELTKHWIETGHQRELPPSVATVLDERIARLSPVARQLLEACAVLGENSNLDRIDQLLEFPPHHLLTGLQELSDTGMLRSSTPSETKEGLQVRHDLLAMEVLKGLAAPALAFLHKRCGLVLERAVLGTSVSTSLLRACAFHWHQAGDSPRAFELAVKCANHLLEIGLAVDSARALEGALVFCRTADQQIEVLERIVHAQRMAGGSAAVLDTISRIRSIQNGGVVSDHHDDLELIEFEARRTIDAQISPLFSRTLRCIYNSTLSVSHRVSAAAIAMKLATGLPDLDELGRIFAEVAPLLNEDGVDRRTRLQVLVVYNTMCGDLQEAIRFARERVRYERLEGTSLQLANALTDLAFVMRRTGPEDEILGVLYEAYEIGIKGKLYAANRDYAERIASFFVDTRRPGADQWIARARESADELPQPNVLYSTIVTKARIALRQNRIDDAARLVNEFELDWLKYRRGWLAAALGIRIRVALASKVEASELLAEVSELRSLYGVTAGLGGQDCEVASLCAGLKAIGDAEDARSLLRDYLSSKRRDLTPYLPELIEVCNLLLTQDETDTLMRIRAAGASNQSSVPGLGFRTDASEAARAVS